MLSLPFLAAIRLEEIAAIERLIQPRASILDFGAGTGEQARFLARRGHRVVAVDLPSSDYQAAQVFPVVPYDGVRLPVASGSVDVVLSSNVLEHIRDPRPIYREFMRVLRPDGFCLHAMPSASWRLWSTLTGFVDLAAVLRAYVTRQPLDPFAPDTRPTRRLLVKALASRILPISHGVASTALEELWTFTRFRWRRHFAVNGFEVEAMLPLGLFYTGHLALGPRLSLPTRRRLAPLLGSACILYRVRPSRTPP